MYVKSEQTVCISHVQKERIMVILAQPQNKIVKHVKLVGIVRRQIRNCLN